MILWATLASASDVVLEDASERLGDVELISLPYDGSGYSGVAILDGDLDGDLDLYFGNGPTQANVLLRNDGDGTFTDVAGPAGAAVWTGSSGVLSADLDDDGAPDLVLPGDRSALRVLHNNGDGSFADVTTATGLLGARRNTSAHAADIDNDGDLDVFVAAGIVPKTNYVNTLWRNNGDNSFTEIAGAAGVATNTGACAATFTHLDDDDAIDLLVANCNDIQLLPTPFEVYRNAGDGTFVDITESSRIWASEHFMGLAIADFDGDGYLDFFSTNVGTVGERRDGPHVLYHNNGDGTWTDVADEAGVGDQTFGWGVVAADFDNDGWEDLYYAGWSHASDNVGSPGLLFLNAGDGTFLPPEIPLDLSERWSSGVAAGDLDGNGWIDIAVAVTRSPDGVPGEPVLLLNRTDNGNHWLSIELQGTRDNGWGIGARVFATATLGGRVRTQQRELHAGSSYMSTNSPWPHFGLGDAVDAELCVRWPDGAHERFGSFGADQRVRLVQGQGTPDTCGPPGPADTSDPRSPGEARRCGCAQGPGPGPVGLLLAGVFLLWRRP
ncbi:MAG TPA: CRTAC1 family protein [Deltaproteobacteria bacterium]|nr:CRTAC1 family protein [Deltaproteobacteria bacterium]